MTSSTENGHDLLDRHRAVAGEVSRLTAPWASRIQAALGPHWEKIVLRITDLGSGDLAAFAERDPAAGGSWRLVLSSYRCYRAVLAHRIAHALVSAVQQNGGCSNCLQGLARDIAEQSKVETGVEVHPGATIGPRFVIDHGIGTVVGETVVIGSDCYLLQGVVLGSTRIADNYGTKRHPTLGNRVEIGSFARVLGPVVIHDDVVVGCHALVKDDVPARARVSVLHQYQVVQAGADVGVAGIEPIGPRRFRLHGHGLHRPGLHVEQYEQADGAGAAAAVVLERTSRHLLIELPEVTEPSSTHLRLTAPDGASTTVVIPSVRLSRRSR